MDAPVSPAMLFILFLGLFTLIAKGLYILREYERAVIFRVGRLASGLIGQNGPGIVIIIPLIDKMVRVSLRTVTMDVPPQDVITKDNVSVKVNAVIYFRVVEAEKAIVGVEDYYYATSMIAQTTLRSVLGQSQLDDLLSKRDEINADLQRIIDQATEPWGIKVSAVEVKNVDLPQEMQRAIARQAEAERERRSKVIHAEGEYQASQRLADAAGILSQNPAALQLRYIETMMNVAGGNNTTILFPVPIDLLSPFTRPAEPAPPAPTPDQSLKRATEWDSEAPAPPAPTPDQSVKRATEWDSEEPSSPAPTPEQSLKHATEWDSEEPAPPGRAPERSPSE